MFTGPDGKSSVLTACGEIACPEMDSSRDTSPEDMGQVGAGSTVVCGNTTLGGCRGVVWVGAAVMDAGVTVG